MEDITSIWSNQDLAWPEYAPDEILPGLWQGGTEDDAVIGCPKPADHYSPEYPFDFVVTLYADSQPAPWWVEEYRFGFFDAALGELTAERVIAIARLAYERWQSGAQVLVRCQAGVNRSGLVSALILMMHGLSAADAIALLREKRSPMVLLNADFERWLLESAPFKLERLAA